MNADVLLTIAFAVYAVLIAVAAGVVIARNWNEPALEEASEPRLRQVREDG
jgi:Flp pilus assembly protein CpaB